MPSRLQLTQSKKEKYGFKFFEELNIEIGESFGIVIEKRMWEYNTRSSFGDYSQVSLLAKMCFAKHESWNKATNSQRTSKGNSANNKD